MVSTDRCYAFRPDVVSTVLDDGAILLDLETKFFYELDPIGWAVASLFEDGARIEDALENARSWGAGAADEPAVLTMIETLVREKLIVPSTPSASKSDVVAPAAWSPPTIRKQEQPLQKIMMSAFDPSVPLLE